MTEPSKEAIGIIDKWTVALYVGDKVETPAGSVVGRIPLALAIDALCAERVAELEGQLRWEKEFSDSQAALITTLTAQCDKYKSEMLDYMETLRMEYHLNGYDVSRAEIERRIAALKEVE